MQRIPVSVQYRHIHLSAEDMTELFGSGYDLTPVKELSHKGQLVYKETVTVLGKNGSIESVRILGPARKETQIEISVTDAVALGINAPIRVSGDASFAAWCTVRGPQGEKNIRRVIIPARHLHCSQKDAEAFGLSHHDRVALRPIGDHGRIISEVTVRVHPTYALEFHLSADEAAEFWLQSGDLVQIASV